LGKFLRVPDAWDFDTAEPISDLIAAADRVVGGFRHRGTGHGPESDMQISCIYTVRGGKIIGFEFFWDHAEALEAAGLE
jgi:ketosteroid isomerase-like protein